MLVLMMVTVFSVEAYDFMENGLAYNINEDGISVQVTRQRVTQSGYSNLSGNLVIPSKVEHDGTLYQVTSIGDLAFFRCSGLTSVVIPNSVTEICYMAFLECTGLTSVDIPNSVTEIGNRAFSGCHNLSLLHIPGSVELIGALAFEACGGLSSITVDEKNTVYDSRDNCNAIVETATNALVLGSNSTVIPNSIESIGMYAFVNCMGLESVVIPNSVTEIGKSAFCACMGLTSLTIGNSVTTIGETAFSYCNGLSSVIIPNSVISIGAQAFANCTQLAMVNIPNSVNYIGGDAFINTIWYNNQPDGLVYAGMVAYKYKGTMPDETSIILRDDCTGVAGLAFYECAGLTSILMPNSVVTIGEKAFSKSGLTSVIIPNLVTSLHDGVFKECLDLTSVNIPNSVTVIDYDAFYGCISLSSIISKIKQPGKVRCLERCFSLVPYNTCVLKVPKGTLQLYQASYPWRLFSNIIEQTEADVNDDGNVTSTDITILYNYLLGTNNDVTDSYDVDGDGAVTAADITAIYNILLGEQ